MPTEPHVTIRRAGPDDESAIVACVDAAYERYIEAIGTKPAPMLDDYAQLISLEQVWVAEIGAALAGLIVMWPEDDHWYVDNIAVDPQRQGQGIGCLLLEAAERSARAARRSEIRLYTNEAMTSNIGFYPRRGFVETHRAEQAGYRRVFYSRRVPQ